jgi:sialic acid synthase SpsE
MHKKIIKHCKKRKIIFLSTPYDEESVDMLEKFKIKAYKVASTDNTNLPLLHYIAKKGKPMFISTAMSNIMEVQDAVKCVKRYIPNKFVLMQCTGNYPSKNSDSNLSVMLTYKKNFGCLYGYSDHTLDFINPVAATALGASVYEKHFTLDRKLDGPDHRMSLLPSELKKTIEIIKNTKIALGNGKKQILDSEKHNRRRLKKSLVTKTLIKKGEKLNKNKLAIKRPGTGLPPKAIFNMMSYVALRDIKANSVLKKKMLKRIK